MLAQGGLFTEHTYTIKVQSQNEPIYIVPFGDIHWGNKECAENLFRRFVEWGADNPNVYWLGMGDYMELTRASVRAKMKAAIGAESLEDFDDMIRVKVDEFTDIIKHMKGRLIGLIEGNHCYEYIDGTTSTQQMCRSLGCKYLGCTTFIHLTLDYHGNKQSLDIFANHGQGGSARLKGGSLNRVQYMSEGVIADIYLMGHDHQRAAVPDTRLKWSQAAGCLREGRVIYARTGSFKRGFIDNHRSYIADKCMKPTDLGGIRIVLNVGRTQSKGVKTCHLDIGVQQ